MNAEKKEEVKQSNSNSTMRKPKEIKNKRRKMLLEQKEAGGDKAGVKPILSPDKKEDNSTKSETEIKEDTNFKPFKIQIDKETILAKKQRRMKKL